jgi:hypothetical protein
MRKTFWEEPGTHGVVAVRTLVLHNTWKRHQTSEHEKSGYHKEFSSGKSLDLNLHS